MKKFVLIIGIALLLAVICVAAFGRTSLEQWSIVALSRYFSFRVPEEAIRVQAYQGPEAVRVQLSNTAAASFVNVNVRIYIPDSSSISYRNGEIAGLKSYLAYDDIPVLKPGQTKTYDVDLKKLNAGMDPGQMRLFVTGYYKYVLKWTHFMADQPLAQSALP